MNNTDLKLFYGTTTKDKETKLTFTCEEGRQYNETDKIPKIELPPKSNNESFLGVLKFAAIVLFIEPLYENF